MKRYMLWIQSMIMVFTLTACSAASRPQESPSNLAAERKADDGGTLIYGSGDYTRINPAMDEHGEINILIFNGLTAHNGKNEVVPGLAKSWDFDEGTCTYTFCLVEDDYIIAFRLAAPNAAFLDYMTMAVLPEHLLRGEDMQESDFFRHPVGTGPYRLENWDAGQAITLVKNEEYFKDKPEIGRIVFKIVPDDNVKAMQMESGELDLALLTPKDAESFAEREGYRRYDMKTSDYRGILFNFRNKYWKKNRDIIPAVCYAIDRQAIVDAVLLGQGAAAYGPLQRNIYNNEDVEHYDYDPGKARQILEDAGCKMGSGGFYERDGETVGFVISVGAGDQVRIDMAQAVIQQLREVGIKCTADIPAQVDWDGQMAYLIGWGSPFDADDHTYKVFGTDKGANYSGYSNELVDRYLTEARQSDDPVVRAEAYAKFQAELAKDPAYAFICYIDADYVADSRIQGIAPDTVMGHHGVGIFWNITEWTIVK